MLWMFTRGFPEKKHLASNIFQMRVSPVESGIGCSFLLLRSETQPSTNSVPPVGALLFLFFFLQSGASPKYSLSEDKWLSVAASQTTGGKSGRRKCCRRKQKRTWAATVAVLSWMLRNQTGRLVGFTQRWAPAWCEGNEDCWEFFPLSSGPRGWTLFSEERNCRGHQ